MNRSRKPGVAQGAAPGGADGVPATAPSRTHSPDDAVLRATSVPERPTAAVLVLHGGSADSEMRVARFSLAVLRLIPVARAVARRNREVAVYRLRFSVRGWNRAGAGVLSDARWALAEIAERHPGLPVVLLGHSLGGRVALYLAATPPAVGAVLLAPWADPHDPVEQLRGGVPLAVVQGSRDRIVPEASTRAWLARAAAAGAVVDSTVIANGGHSMIRFVRRWHRLAADGVRTVLRGVPAADSPASAPAVHP